MSARYAVLLAASFAAGVGCSLAYDWDDESGLPCPCKPDSVCLRTTNVCVPKGSVDDYKSCSLDAEFPDDLCKQGTRCLDLRDGPKCLPRCTPSNYATFEAGERIRAQCGTGRTCWHVPGGNAGEGVCETGECQEIANDCPPPGRCAAFNLAGVCFTTCRILEADTGCLGTQACHPLGATSVTACIEPGVRQPGEVCSDLDPCAKTDGTGRPLICDKPAGSSDQLRCLKRCTFGSPAGCDVSEACVFSRPDIDPDHRGVGLGVCIRG